MNPMKQQKLRDELAATEERISELESQIAQNEASLADYKSAEESMRLSTLLGTLREELETRVTRWEQLSEELEA